MKRSIMIGSHPVGLFGRIFATLSLGFFVLVGLVIGAVGAYFIIFPHLWPEVEMRVASSQLLENETNSRESAGFKVEVAYAYEYKGRSFEQKDTHTFTDYREAKAFADAFVPGATRVCHVNPFNPEKSTIQRGSLLMALFLIIPLIFVLLPGAGIYGIWSGRPGGAGGPSSYSTALSRNLPAGAGRGFLLLFFSFFLLAGLGFFIPLFVRPVVKIVQAKNWVQVPCTIISSEVRSYRDSEGDTQHRADVFYRYTFQGREFRSNQHRFHSLSTTESSRSVAATYPAGSTAVCYVNPSDPTEAVLEREFTPGLLFGLFPLLFVAVGGIGLTYQLRRRPAPGQSARDLSALGPGSTKWASAENSRPGGTGPVVLKPKHGPWAKFLWITGFALFWNGITSFFVVHVVDDWLRGRGEWFPTLLMIPFVLAGLALMGAVIHSLLALANPRPSLTVSSNMVPLGESIQIEWRLRGRVHSLQDFRLSFVGVEEAQYRHGTSTATDTETFTEIALATVTNHFDMRWGKVRLTVPADTMHSLDTGNNKILWEVRVKGAIRFWPDLNESFPITVLPMPLNQSGEHPYAQTASDFGR